MAVRVNYIISGLGMGDNLLKLIIIMQMYYQQQSHPTECLDQRQLGLEDDINILCNSKPIKVSSNPVEKYPRQKQYKKLIIHDIHLLSRRAKLLQNNKQQPQKVGHTSSLKELLMQTLLPSPHHQQFEVIKAGLKSNSHQNDEYLKNNMNTIKQKIRNKVLKQKVDFADSPRPKLSLCERRQTTKQNSPLRQRITKYNHDFEEYLIRKKINKKCKTLSYELPTYSSDLEESTLAEQMKKEAQMVLLGLGKGKKRSIGQESGGSKMIVVSHLHPVKNSVKFKNIVIETARKPMSKYDEAKLFLRKYVHRHLNRATRSYEKPLGVSEEKREDNDFSSMKVKSAISPVTFIKSPLNYTLAKKELNRLRKENIGLPLLLQPQDKTQAQRNQAILQQKLNAKKILSHSEQARKHVIYSKKNAGVVQMEELLQQQKTLIL